MDKQEASALIAEKVEQAYTLLKEAEAIADNHGLSFSFNVTYGAGAWYESNEGWVASSQGC